MITEGMSLIIIELPPIFILTSMFTIVWFSLSNPSICQLLSLIIFYMLMVLSPDFLRNFYPFYHQIIDVPEIVFLMFNPKIPKEAHTFIIWDSWISITSFRLPFLGLLIFRRSIVGINCQLISHIVEVLAKLPFFSL